MTHKLRLTDIPTLHKLNGLFQEDILPTKKSYFPLSVCFHTSIVVISNSLNIKFESALFQFHSERKRRGEGLDGVSVFVAGNTCGFYNLISDHYKVTTGPGLAEAE